MRKLFSVICVLAATVAARPLIFAVPDAGSDQFLRMLDASGVLKAGERFERNQEFRKGHLYSTSISLNEPSKLDSQLVLRFRLYDAQQEMASKSLHPGDPDAYVLVRPASDGTGRITLESTRGSAGAIGYAITVREWPAMSGKDAIIEAEPNNTWQQATAIELEKPVFATCDDREFIPPLSAADSNPATFVRASLNPEPRTLNPENGVDWYTFTYAGEMPKLVHFGLDFLDREVPVDILVFRQNGEQIEEWKKGADPVSDPHEVQALPGNKFTTRVIEKGTYFLQVKGNHPAYQLRTFVYDVPPYDSQSLPLAAQKAVRVAMDFSIAAGDSWHANTPRAGGVLTRVASVHNETAQCIACHPTHFTTRAQMVAVTNGYPVKQRGALKFLTERLYNNPRPFYGHKGATWGRMISSSANVMSRLAYMLNLHEHNVSREFRSECLEGVGGYLKIYYKDRTEIPPDESNGNTPLVSTYEVAGHSWIIFDELYRRTKKEDYAAYRDQVRRLTEQDKIKDMRDLCYQTIAFAQIDPKAYADRIKKNCERILTLQRESGQWAMVFDRSAPEAEFQTGHCLYTLALSGYSPDHPQIAKGIRYLLSHQQPFGGWHDPLHSYENFKTPFRETQFAIMGLSQFYPLKLTSQPANQQTKSGWSAGFPPQPQRLDFSKPDTLIAQLDQVWDAPQHATMQDILRAANHDEPFVKAAACETLGRVGNEHAVAILIQALGDRSKLARHAAAWGLRELASRKRIGVDEVNKALINSDDYAKRGTIRIFGQHFSSLTHIPSAATLVEALVANLSDQDVFVRVYTSKALSQWFYWTDDEAIQAMIAAAYLKRMSVNEHPWARRALLENFYSICDDNIRYLYRNWIPLLAKQEDRDKAIQGHRAVMRMLSEKIAEALAGGNAIQRDNLLLALTEFHLRKTSDRKGYDAPILTPANLYSRIGNDVEQIKFYEESTEILEPVFERLLDDPVTRPAALIASFTMREVSNLERLPLRFLQIIAADTNARNRETAWEYYRFLPIVVTERNREEWAKQLKQMSTGYLEARKATFDTLARGGAQFQEMNEIATALANYLESEAANSWRPELLAALAAMPKLHARAEVKSFVQEALRSSDEAPLRAALQLVLSSAPLQRDLSIRATLHETLSDKNLKARRLALDIVNRNSALLENLQVVSLVADALDDSDSVGRSAALAAVQKSKTLQQNPAVRLALSAVMKDPNARDAALAAALYNGESATFKDTDVTQLLDYEFFKSKVQPIFFKPAGRDGNACVNCHFNHSILQIYRQPDGTIKEEDIRANYRSALKVVNLADPTRSLILMKPTSDASTEGQIGASKISHGGDRRWPKGEQSEDYQAILAWISGSKLKN